MDMTGTAEFAITYALRGWKVLPIHGISAGRCTCGRADCSSPGKHPAIAHGVKEASSDLDQIAQWFSVSKNLNVAISTGEESGLIVLDIDPRHGGDESTLALAAKHGRLPDTLEVLTGGGGRHLYFKFPAGADIRSRAGILPGVDIRANGGYVVCPPSRHISGGVYQWEASCDFEHDEPAELPQWLLDMLLTGGQPQSHPSPNGHKPDKILQGQRNDWLTSEAGRLRRAGADEATITATLLTLNRERCVPPLPEREVETIAKSVCRYQPGYTLSDLGNAMRFRDQWQGTTRYCYPLKTWFCWTGKVWQPGEAEVLRRMHETVKTIYIEAQNAPDPTTRKQTGAHAIRSESHMRVVSALEAAKPYMETEPPNYEAYADFLNCQNGLVELSTGRLLPHDPTKFITHLLPVKYDPQAKCPEWRKFIDLMTSNQPGLSDWLQVLTGYLLTGRTDEQAFFLLIGSGRNGKTTYVETLKMLLQEQMVKIAIETLLSSGDKSNGEGPSPMKMKLFGARVAYANEIPPNRRLNTALVKDLTGNDSLSARPLHGKVIEWRPTHKLLVYGQYKPQISEGDFGIWRRVRVIPFTTDIGDVCQIRPQTEVLATFRQELPGILAWAVEGARRWYANGLGMPDEVKQATQEYRTDEDLISQFIAERCLTQGQVAKTVLYKAYQQWCLDNAENFLGKKAFTRQILARGYREGGNGRSMVIGL